MRQVTKTYNVYDFSELNEKAQEKAIDHAVGFFIEFYAYDDLSPAMQKAINKAERMKTPWFVGSYIWDYAKDEILAECNEYEYLEDGSIFSESL